MVKGGSLSVVGAGIAGLASAIAARRRSFEVFVYESRSALPTGGGVLLLWANGVKALRALDPELERVGGDDREELALGELVLDLAALGRRVARAVGSDPLGQVAAPRVLEPELREALDQLDAAARLQEADRSHLRLHQLGQELRRLRQRRAADARVLVHERRVPHHDLPLRVRRTVVID